MIRLFKIRYPKITLLIICIILAYFIFSLQSVQQLFRNFGTTSYLGVFFAGFLFSFGFTTPFAIGAFLIMNPASILLAAIVGGIGAMLADLTIFGIIKISFMDEFRMMAKKKTFKKIHLIPLNKKIKHYLIYAFAGIVIASPLPDELGISMLAGLGHVKVFPIALISFIFNTLGILIFLLI